MSTIHLSRSEKLNLTMLLYGVRSAIQMNATPAAYFQACERDYSLLLEGKQPLLMTTAIRRDLEIMTDEQRQINDQIEFLQTASESAGRLLRFGGEIAQRAQEMIEEIDEKLYEETMNLTSLNEHIEDIWSQYPGEQWLAGRNDL